MFELKSDYFNSAYLGPTPVLARRRVEESLRQTMDPAFFLYDDWYKFTDEIRARFGKLLGAPADHIALSTSVSELVSHVANGLELHAGDEVILLDGDYPAMVLPWMLAAEYRGFQIHRLPLEDFLQPHNLRRHFTDRTRYVGCSHVMFNTGTQLPIAEIGKLCRENGVLFLADTSQSFGGMTITKEIVTNVDILVGVAYKWLLGPYGSAYGYFSDSALKSVRRTHANWLVAPSSKQSENLLNYTLETLPGARKFDRGQSSSYLITAALGGALDVILETGLAQIEKHNRKLVDNFLENLPNHFEIAGHPEYLSNIVCIKPPNEDAMAAKLRLKKKNIDVSVREGFLRIAFHFFNTEEQVQKLLRELS